jgi:pyruvate ferredoxin oxidoreductase gamma subunit
MGGINPRIGSTVSNDLSPSRQGYIPLFVQERCIHCGLCDSTCPDQVFQFMPGVYKGKETMVNNGLDYYHCKGCLRCVEICPTKALMEVPEKDYPEKPHFMSCKDLLPDALTYQKTGANSWITSDSFFMEKNLDGGVS